jgi:predicted ATPase
MLNDYGKESGLFDSFDVKQHGDDTTSLFELLVTRSNTNYKITSVGYGVSQILPIIIELLKERYGMFMVQQPEVHLHPKAQAAFGAFLSNIASILQENTFIVETHSDYIIDRFRYQMKESETKVSAQVLFFKNDGMHNHIVPINIQNNGEYIGDDNLYEFRSFFVDEAFKMMEI